MDFRDFMNTVLSKYLPEKKLGGTNNARTLTKKMILKIL